LESGSHCWHHYEIILQKIPTQGKLIQSNVIHWHIPEAI
jgi:hypothetical protein